MEIGFEDQASLKHLRKGLIHSALFYFSIFSFIFLSGCGHLFYYPDRVLYFDPKKHKLEYQEVHFKSLDGTEIVGWYFKAQPWVPGKAVSSKVVGSKATNLKAKDSVVKPTLQNRWPAQRARKNRTVIHFHGNAQNVSSHFSQLYWMTQFGYDYFILDYRGYGGSRGEPKHKGVQEDVVASIEYILGGGPTGEVPKQVILYGQSLGGASLLGAFDNIKDKSKIEAVIVEGAFSSYQRIARRKMSSWWLSWPFQWLPYLVLSDRYSGDKNIEKISPIPLLVIHGKADKIVEPNEGQDIFKRGQEPKQLWMIDGADHLQSYFVEQGAYQDKLIEYLERVEKPLAQ
ncbi:MAG: alpha/beta hydrolase [Bdellovibrionota bacterium]